MPLPLIFQECNVVKTYLPCLLLLCAAPVFAKPTLTVYTYDSFAADWGPGPAVKKPSKPSATVN